MNTTTTLKSVDAVESGLLAAVHDAWKKLAAGRLAPKREEITPAMIKSALPWIWMIDVVDDGADFRFRIAGDRVVQFLGRRYAGLLLSEFQGEPFFQRMRAILVESVKHKRPLAAGPMGSNMAGKEFLEMEVVVLPLSEDNQRVTTIFGAMEVRPTAKTKPAEASTPA
jgi:hypothetical protein